MEEKKQTNNDNQSTGILGILFIIFFIVILIFGEEDEDYSQRIELCNSLDRCSWSIIKKDCVCK